ncbi:MAG: EAL domain-containing protein [Acetobacter sp.]|nr:EAL domain-containing protein [Acetobacter sp.]
MKFEGSENRFNRTLWRCVLLVFLFVCVCFIESYKYYEAVFLTRTIYSKTVRNYANLISQRLNARFIALEVAFATLSSGSDSVGSAVFSKPSTLSLPGATRPPQQHSIQPSVFTGEEHFSWRFVLQGPKQQEPKKRADISKSHFSFIGEGDKYQIGFVHKDKETGFFVLPMRIKGETRDNVKYYLSTSYNLAKLLSRNGFSQKQELLAFDITDMRTGLSIYGLPIYEENKVGQKTAVEHTFSKNSNISARVADYPFKVQSFLSKAEIWSIYIKYARNRWITECLAILSIVLMNELFLLYREKKSVYSLQRLMRFNVFKTELNQLLVQHKKESHWAQVLCDIAIKSQCFKVALVVRPDEKGNALTLAMSGPKGCENGLSVSFNIYHDEKDNILTRSWHENRVIINNTFGNNLLNEKEKTWAKKYGLGFQAVLPIRHDNEIWGLLCVYNNKIKETFNDKLEAFLNEIVIDISCFFVSLYDRCFYEELFDNRIVGVLLVKRGIIHYANTYITQIFGLSLEEIKKLSVEKFCSDRMDSQRILDTDQSLCSDESVKVSNVFITRQDEKLMITDFSGVRLKPPAGDLTLWMVENVTQRWLEGFFNKALLDVSDIALWATAEDEVCSKICVSLSCNSFFHTVWIGRCDHANKKLTVVTASGDGTSGIDTVDYTSGADGFFVPMQAWQRQKVFYRNDKISSNNSKSDVYDFVKRSHFWRSVLSAPIWRSGKVWGIITFVSAYPDVFNKKSVTMCNRISSLVGSTLEKLEYHQRIKNMQVEDSRRARRDMLTDLPNRLALTEFLPQAFARARRYGTLVAVGVFDLDDFKQVNDVYGHTEGDKLLKELAIRVQKTMRETDFVVRMGGDEFVIVFEGLSTTNLNLQISRALEHLHTVIETPFDIAENIQVTIGMTMGVAFFPLDGESADALLRAADMAMYRCKKEKAVRKQWWYLASESENNNTQQQSEATQSIEGLFDAYGTDARGLLTHFKFFVDKLAQDFAQRFDEVFSKSSAWKSIFVSLSSRDIAWLKRYQVRHIRLLLSPTATRERIKRVAVKQGVMCFLSGVDAGLLTEMYSLFRCLLIDYLNRAMVRATDRYHMLLVSELRLQDDKVTQLETAHAIEHEYLSKIANLPNTIDEILKRLGRLSGIQGVILFRVNAEGELIVDKGCGHKKDDIMAVLNTTAYRQILSECRVTGHSVAVLAWKTRKIQSSSALITTPWMSAWRNIALRLCICSTMSIPIIGEKGNVVAVLSMYGRYPGQFQSLVLQQFSKNLQRQLSVLWCHAQDHARDSIVDVRSEHLRRRLFSGGLRVFVQPIIDIRTGELLKIEALARIEDVDGDIISPRVFLPLLNESELHRLFEETLTQSLQVLASFEKHGLITNVSVNMPPSYLLNFQGFNVVDVALSQYNIAPHRVTIELLEMEDIDQNIQNVNIRRYRNMGLQTAIDDLGSGYSSLLRLSTLPFDVIKVDQGVLRKVYETPLQVFSVISSILNMSKDFSSSVVIEGVENIDMLEAVYYLQAFYIQGYAVARPMPSEKFLEWYHQYHQGHGCSPTKITTPLGALAYYWMALRVGYTLTSFEDCPLTQWLLDSGLDKDDVFKWHADFHKGNIHSDGVQNLSAYLIRRVLESEFTKKE